MKYLQILLLLTISITKIYSQNNYYTNPWNNSDFDSKTITLPTVGSTPGSASVSSGSASYNIPIHVPPGTNGVVPSLSVSYNSMSGNGVLGMGWSLSGLSAITRTGKSIHLDGKVTAVEISNNDRFALDGSALLNLSGSNGANESIYGSEIENFTRIISYDTTGIEGPGWFKAITKDGVIMEFGHTADSRRVAQIPSGNTFIVKALYWKINKIIFPEGNYIQFIYHNEYSDGDNESRIIKIKYQGNINGLDASDQVSFNYISSRIDPQINYEAGEVIQNKSLLFSITTIAKIYYFNYASDTNNSNNGNAINSYLKEIIETANGSGTALNSTIFKYGDQPSDFTLGATPTHSSPDPNLNGTEIALAQDSDLFSGDFNGDGYTDILASEKDYATNDPYKYYKNFKIFKKVPETETYIRSEPIVLESSYSIINKKKTNDRQNYLARDFTGEGRDDILTAQTSASGTIRSLLNLRLFASKEINGNLSFDQYDIAMPDEDFNNDGTVPKNDGYSQISSTNNFLFSGDYDGDGLQDIFLILKNGINSRLYLRYGDSSPNATCTNSINQNLNSCFQQVNNNSTFITSSDISNGLINIIDFDGDGKNEIMVMHGTETEIFSFERVNYLGTKKHQYTLTNSLFKNNTTSTPGIYNYAISGNNLLYFGDFNGDRKTDIFYRPSILTTSKYWQIAISTGKNFSIVNFTFDDDKIPNTINYTGDQLSIADFNGDGKTDIFHAYNSSGGSGYNTLMYNYYSRGDGTFFAAPIQINANHQLGSTENNYVYDINGDGRADLVSIYPQTNPVTLWKFDVLYLKKDGKENLLEKIKTGNGQITEFNYRRINEGGSFYSQGDLNQYDITINPINNIRLPIYCVSAFKYNNGIGGINTTTYNYEQAKLHKSGKGLLGFYRITSFNDATKDNTFRLKSVEENQFLINSTGASPKTFYVSIPYKSTNYLTSNFTTTPSDELLSESTFTNSVSDLGSNRYFLKLDQIDIINAFEKRKSVTSNSYDLDGNVTSNTVKIRARKTDNTADEDLETIITATVFGKFPDVGFKNKPTLVTISKTRKGQSQYSVKNFAQYNSLGQVDYKIDFYETQKAVKTQYTYDEKDIPNSTNKYTLGNIVKTTVSSVPLAGNSSDFTTRETSTIYDTWGRFPTSTTNELGQTSTIVSEDNWGKPTSITGSDGLTTTMEYDAFGRIIKTNYPTGFFATQKYEWVGTNGHYKITADTFENSNPNTPKGKPKTITYFDILGREYQKEVEGFKSSSSADNIFTGQVYDNRGNISTTFKPSKGPISISNINNVYDKYNRIIEINSSNTVFGNTLIEYSGYSIDGKLTITTKEPDFTTANSKLSSKTTDATGKLFSATDNGGALFYTYNSQGNLTHVNSGTEASPIYNTISDFDIYGRQISLIDLNAGTTTYIYNGLGQLVSETNPKGTTTMNYDIGGRVTSRVGEEGTTSYEYYDDTNDPIASKKKLKKVTSFAAGNSEEYSYDNMGRLSNSVDIIDGKTLNTYFQYNSFNDIINKQYPTNLLINYIYDENGYLEYIKNFADASNFIYKATEMNAYGQFNKYELGNGKSSETTYYEGMPTNYNTNGVQNLTLQWNYKNGNLDKRTNNLNARVEDFTYDFLDRLTKAKVVGQAEYNTKYTENGNISEKTDVGNPYVYSANKVTSVEHNNNKISPQEKQEITYTSFQQPLLVKEKIANQTALWELAFTYGSDYNRIKTVLSLAGEEKIKRYYFGDYEESTDIVQNATHKLAYISSPVGLIAIIDGNSTSNYHYTYTDHLGSIVATTDGAGNNVKNFDYDAWGQRRNSTSWVVLTYNESLAEANQNTWLYRGYTGHEMLDHFGLINMNGRMYDPLIGRVLSPDNYVQDATSSQDYNRYTYAHNNPLKYNDPDGNNPLVGAAIGGAGYFLSTLFSPGGLKENWNWGQFGLSVAAGAIGGFIAPGIGDAVNGLGKGAWAVQAGMHGILAGNLSVMQGGNFGSGFLTGMAGSLMGTATAKGGTAGQIVSSALFSGAVAGLSGGNFWKGAAQGAIIAGLNHVGHQIQNEIKEKIEALAKLAEYYSKIESTDWNKKSAIPKGYWKCNIFVHDLLVQLGMNPTDFQLFARDWANPNKVINGWPVVTDGGAQRGDIGAYSENNSDATGHMGIMQNSKIMIYTNEFKVVRSYVNNSDWSKKIFIYRRFTGKN